MPFLAYKRNPGSVGRGGARETMHCFNNSYHVSYTRTHQSRHSQAQERGRSQQRARQHNTYVANYVGAWGCGGLANYARNYGVKCGKRKFATTPSLY